MTFSRSKAGTAPARPPRQAWVLEQRMMFDAAAATADAVAAQVIAPTESAPGVDATPAHGTVTINDGDTGFAAVDLFSNVSVSTDTGADSSGKELTELVITVDRSGANQALMIDGSEIALKPTTTGTYATHDNSYKVTVSGDTNTITVFAVDSTGRLTQQQSLVVENLGTVNHLVVSADSKSVYTIASNGNLIHLSVNDGKLAYVSTTALEGGGSTGGLAISDDGKQVYVDTSSNYGREVYVYNRDADGVLTQVQKLDAHRNGMIATSGDYVYVIHSGALFFYPHELKVYQRDATTGILTLVDGISLTKTGQDAVDYAMTTSKDGTLLYVGDPTSANIDIYQLGSDNTLALINTVTSDKIGSLTLNSDGTQLYAATTTGTVNVYAVGENGSLTLTGSSTGTTNGGDIAVTADGKSILVSGNGISRYLPIQTLLRGGEITLAHGLTLSDANNDRLAEGNGDYNGTKLTLSRATHAQADDQFGFAQGSGLQLIDRKIMKGDTAIATFSQSAGTLTLTFLAGASKADANAVLHQITCSNTGADTNGTLSGYSEYVTAIAVSADGKTLLVSGSDGANAGGNSTLRIYSRNSTTGELTLVQTFIQGESDNPETATIEANGLSGITTMTMHGNDLYVAGHSGDATTYSLVRFTYDTTTGQYTYAGIVATQGVNDVTGLDAQITEIVISADGKSLYTINGVTSIDGATGKSVLSQFSRDPSTGALTYLAAYQGGTNELGMNAPSGMVISGDGKSVYVANRSGSMLTLFSRNTETGELTYTGFINNATIIADPDSGERPSGSIYLTELHNIVISPDGSFVYVGSVQQATVSIFSRDANDGSLTYVSTLSLYTNVSALNIREMALSSDGTALYVGFNGSVLAMLSRDSATGSLTYVSKQDVGVRTNHIAVTPDGLNIYSGRSQFTTGLTILSSLPHAGYTTNVSTTFAEGLSFSDVDADQITDYKGTTLTVNRANGASADDQFGFKNGSGLRLEDGKVMKGKATIATFAAQDGVLTITFSADVDKSIANQVLQQVTYLNTNAEAPTRVDLNITVRDSGGKSAETAVAPLLTDTPVEPTLSAEGKQTTATITSSGLPGAVDLFDNVDVRLGKAGAALSELTFTIDRSGPHETLVIDGTTIVLTGSEGETAQGHHYQVKVNDGTATITLTLNSSSTPDAVNTLIDNIHYQVVNSDVAQGAVTVTLTQLVDANDNTTTLDIHSTVAVLDTRLTSHLAV
ncbi:MAG: beta-propeller fold lactonase family protein [Symbiopectobacterium sp.]|uniref:beta-propeller fold lactonase family protein n=1 Tax=Symbiopectobacterium sp. TaxID=2952789 RepID=UPI0039EB8702